MRRYTNITIERAAVHVVAPRRGQLLQSTAPIHLDDPVRAFLAEHIGKGLADGQALAARFKVVGTDRAEGLCRAMVASANSFVNRSADLAKLLYDASRKEAGTDARVSDGALVVARCGATSTTKQLKFVALLKLDPSDAFRAEEATENGKPVVRLVAQRDILPSPRERLQKAAFVRGTGFEYDALAVDHQRRGEVVSAFFLDGFLGLEHASDPEQRTKVLYRTLQETFDEHKDQLTSDQYAQLDTYIRGAVAGGHVNVDTITEGLPAPDAVKQAFVAQLDALTDRDFDTDPVTVATLLRRRRFAGDNGLSLSVRGDHYGDMVSVQPPTTGQDDYIVTIRTKEWNER